MVNPVSTTNGLESVYLDYLANPTPDASTALYASCRRYAAKLSQVYGRRDTDDVIQSVTVKVWAKLGTIPAGVPFVSWFRATCIHHLMDLHRRWITEQHAIGSPLSLESMPIAPSASAGDELPIRDVMELPLSARQRASVQVLIDSDGDHSAAAKSLDISPAALRQRLYKILRLLDTKRSSKS